jgi:FG-GAP-like repeat
LYILIQLPIDEVIMTENKFLKTLVFSISLFSLIFTAFVINASAQCAGVYFKRTSNTLIQNVNNVTINYAEDMTGDGIPDLVGVGADSLPNGFNKIVIVPANGTGGFGSQIVITTPASTAIETYITGDFDSNAFRDVLVILNTAPNTILVYKNNGNGTFTAQTLQPLSHGQPVWLGDINNDGKGDYIGFFNDSSYKYSLGNGDGTFGTPVTLYQGSGVFVPGDFSGDGKIDFLTGAGMLINMGGGIFSVAPGVSFAQYEFVQHVKDFTGDGKPDLLTITLSQPTIKIALLKNNGDNTFSRTDYIVADNQTNANWYGQTHVGNFSGNSALDVIYRVDTPTLNKTVVFTNNGSGTFTRQDYDYRLNGRFEGDYNNDGKTDFAGTGTTSIFHEAFATVRTNVCNQPGQTEVVDFNRDEQTDFTVWNPASGDWTYFPAFSTPQTINWGLGSFGDIPMPGDYDKDGITDVAVFRNSTGAWYIRQSSNAAWYVIQWGVSGDKPVSQDYDGDGYSDIAVFRPSDGNWYIWFMGTQNYTILHFGATGDIPVPEDYDADGKTDLAVYRPSTGVWYVLRSSDGNYTATAWGISTDKPVASDYDGDGKADIAVWRESEGNWYILRSSNSQFAVYNFGTTGDKPQPGDYNGDGAFDAGIYRPTVTKWYTSIDNYETIFGASGAIPVSSILRVE